MLQQVNTFIDTIQGAKSTFVKNFVQDAKLAKTLQSYVDTQTTFVKQAAETSFDVAYSVADQASKFDYQKVFSFGK